MCIDKRQSIQLTKWVTLIANRFYLLTDILINYVNDSQVSYTQL